MINANAVTRGDSRDGDGVNSELFQFGLSLIHFGEVSFAILWIL